MKEIESRKAWDLLMHNKDAILIDVREQQEWDAGHVDLTHAKKSAILVTISNDFDRFIHMLENAVPKSKGPFLFFCRSGARSETAAMLAEKSGYKDSYNILGGFIKWVENDLPHSNAGERNA